MHKHHFRPSLFNHVISAWLGFFFSPVLAGIAGVVYSVFIWAPAVRADTAYYEAITEDGVAMGVYLGSLGCANIGVCVGGGWVIAVVCVYLGRLLTYHSLPRLTGN